MKQLMKMIWVAALVLFAGAATAQYREPPRGGFSQAELDQMLAPIALYPDSLLSQILTASTYPRDVAEAASWSRANSSVRGDTAVRLIENEPWDPSVLALAAFPQVLSMMAALPSKSIPASANGGHNETTAAYRLFDTCKLSQLNRYHS